MLDFIRFTRPHTVIGTTISILALYAIALAEASDPSYYPLHLMLTLTACLGANIYIVGLNQLTDIEIDKINKPYLPMASGAWSIKKGIVVILVALSISLVISLYVGKFLLLTVILSLILGTIYSMPPFRLKQYPFWAAICILAVRGVIVNIFLYLNFSSVISGQTHIPITIIILTAIILIYSIVIALYKDLPDNEGDLRYNISTFSVRLGRQNVFRIGFGLMSLIFITVILYFIFNKAIENSSIPAIGHAAILIFFWIMAYRVNLQNASSIAFFYQMVWLMYYLEYALFVWSVWV